MKMNYNRKSFNLARLFRPSSDSNIKHHIQLLFSLYTANVGLTLSYLSELKSVAKSCGADFEKVLLEELARIQHSTKQDCPVEHKELIVETTPLCTPETNTVAVPERQIRP